MGFVGLEEITRGSVARFRGPADEGDALGVEGPGRIGVSVDTRREEANSFRGDVIDADEAVIAARGDKYELGTVGRPLFGVILAADNQVIGLVDGVNGREIELTVAYVGDALCGGFGGIADVNFFGLAAVPGDAPNSLLRARGIARGVGELAGTVLAFAANVDDGIGIVGKIQVRDGLAVVFEIGCESPGLEGRSFGHPDVALAFLVERAGDAIGFFGGFQVLRKRRAQELL